MIYKKLVAIAHKTGTDLVFAQKQGQILFLHTKQGQTLFLHTKQGQTLFLHTKQGQTLFLHIKQGQTLFFKLYFNTSSQGTLTLKVLTRSYSGVVLTPEYKRLLSKLKSSLIKYK